MLSEVFIVPRWGAYFATATYCHVKTTSDITHYETNQSQSDTHLLAGERRRSSG